MVLLGRPSRLIKKHKLEKKGFKTFLFQHVSPAHRGSYRPSSCWSRPPPWWATLWSHRHNSGFAFDVSELCPALEIVLDDAKQRLFWCVHSRDWSLFLDKFGCGGTLKSMLRAELTTPFIILAMILISKPKGPNEHTVIMSASPLHSRSEREQNYWFPPKQRRPSAATARRQPPSAFHSPTPKSTWRSQSRQCCSWKSH